MKFVFNPFTANLDVIEDHFGLSGIFITDADGVEWQVTVDTSGNLVTTRVATTAGTPMGLLLALTYST